MLDRLRAQTAGIYGPHFKKLNLSPEQVARFLELSMQGASAQFTGPNGASLVYRLDGERAEAQRELRALLGEEGFSRYREFSNSALPAFQTALRLAAALYRTTPLTMAQADQLQDLLMQGRTTVAWSPRPQFDWPAIEANARLILSERQLMGLAHLRAQDEVHQGWAQSRHTPASTARPGDSSTPRDESP